MTGRENRNRRSALRQLFWCLSLACVIGTHAVAQRPPDSPQGQPPSNPFGAVDPNQPPPSDISDFQEDDLGGGADAKGFGFSPPKNTAPNQPPAGNGQNLNPGPRNAPNTGSNNRSNFAGANGQSAGAPPRGQGAKSNARKAPKLADYLELDSSVKGLEVKNFDLPDKDIKDVVTLISKWTGKNFILDSKVRGKITIIGPSQVTLQEAYQAFLSALEANGLTTVQSGKFIRIIESAEARRAPVKTYSGEYAPKDDQFITRIFQLKHINSDEVQREFRDMTTRQGKLFAYEPTNSIIITDTGSNIQRIKEILETLDVKGFETTLHVVRIKNGSAKTISDMLGEIYGEKGGQGGASRSFRRSSLERTRGGGIISKIIPDEATNSLVVLANQAGIESLKKLVDKLDVKVTDTGRIHVYYCEYAKAEDLAATLASLSSNGGGSNTGKSGSRKTSVTTPNSPTGGAGGGSISGGPAAPVTAELEGGVKITSDGATNALVITANSADYQTLKRVIRKLDIPRLQVFVETAILEISVGAIHTYGSSVGLGAPGRGFAGGFVGDQATLLQYLSNGIPGVGASIPIFAGPSFPATFTSGAQTVSGTVSSFMAFLNFITTNSNSSILSTPQIIALDNEKAVFKVLDETPVQTTASFQPGQSTGSGFGVGNIERLKTGIQIELTPHVNAASGSVRLEIQQQVDATKEEGVPAALQGIQKATTSRITNTSVVVHDQDFVMLGGLMQNKVDESIKKVPLLGDIPILGWLFKSKTLTVSKTNLVVLLHPRVIGNSVASANLIKEKLDKREDFIKKFYGDDEHEEGVKEITNQIMNQQKSNHDDQKFMYRNNDEENDDDKKVPPGQRGEIGRQPEKKAKAESSNNNPNPPPGQNFDEAPLLAIPPSNEPPPTMPPPEPSGG